MAVIIKNYKPFSVHPFCAHVYYVQVTIREAVIKDQALQEFTDFSVSTSVSPEAAFVLLAVVQQLTDLVVSSTDAHSPFS